MTEVVAALIRRGDRFLICQRPKGKKRELLYEFVGGKVEPGETREQALARECREELDVSLEVGREYLSVVHEYEDITIRLTVFCAAIPHGEPRRVEHADLRWIPVSEIGEYAFCPADTTILDTLMREGLPDA